MALLDSIRVNEPGPGRPRKRPEVLIADKGYAHDSTRRAPRPRGIRHVIPERSDQVARRNAKGSPGGRPPAFVKQVHRIRNVVERFFNRFKQWRDLATRYAKRACIPLPIKPGPHRRHHLAPMTALRPLLHALT